MQGGGKLDQDDGGQQDQDVRLGEQDALLASGYAGSS